MSATKTVKLGVLHSRSDSRARADAGAVGEGGREGELKIIVTYERSALNDVLPYQDIYMLAYRGSIAHGMYIPNTDQNSIDDVDLMGVVIGKPLSNRIYKGWSIEKALSYRNPRSAIAAAMDEGDAR